MRHVRRQQGHHGRAGRRARGGRGRTRPRRRRRAAASRCRGCAAGRRARGKWACSTSATPATSGRQARTRAAGPMSGTYKTRRAPSRRPWRHGRRFDTKIAVLLRDDLATWQRLNVTAFLVSGVAAAVRDHRRAVRRTPTAPTYLPMFGQPVLVFEGDAETLTAAHARALRRELPVAVFTSDLFPTGNDDDNRAAVAGRRPRTSSTWSASPCTARATPSTIAQDGDPGQPGLERLEADPLEQGVVPVQRRAPLLVVVGDVLRRAVRPRAAEGLCVHDGKLTRGCDSSRGPVATVPA